MKLQCRIILCVLSLAACSHPAKSSSDIAPSPKAENDVVIPPRMTGTFNTIRFTSVGGTRPHGNIEIPIDANGRPDIYGIRFIGSFSDSFRRDIAEFVGQASFLPGTRNGVPEKSITKMIFK